MSIFIPGLKLSEDFFQEAVKPILNKHFPKLKYSAARIGRGSDVMGFDTERSMDHDWGPRLELFLTESDYSKYKKKIEMVLAKELPSNFRGFSTHFSKEIGSQVLEQHVSGLINHKIEIYTLKLFFKQYLNWDSKSKLTHFVWLTFPEQKLATIRAGKIFHDNLGLTQIKKQLDYFPNDVWLYILASQWARVGQEEPFVARTGDVGDEPGSRLISARLINDVMRLCFIMEKQYAPYSKWFGTAFSRLKCAKTIVPLMHHALDSKTWKERESSMGSVYEQIAKLHNELGLTKTMNSKVSNFHDRPYLVIHAGDFAQEIRKQIKSKEIKKIKLLFGSVNQFSNSTEILDNFDTSKLKLVYK